MNKLTLTVVLVESPSDWKPWPEAPFDAYPPKKRQKKGLTKLIHIGRHAFIVQIKNFNPYREEFNWQVKMAKIQKEVKTKSNYNKTTYKDKIQNSMGSSIL